MNPHHVPSFYSRSGTMCSLTDLFAPPEERKVYFVPPNKTSKRPRNESTGSFVTIHKAINCGFSFRLEHVVESEKKHRIVLFRSDRAGAIGKIIFSIDVQQSGLQAEIQVLEVKAPYRGFDLGGLLIRCAMEQVSRNAVKLSSFVWMLRAEEEVGRHDHLVAFYRRFGFHQAANQSISYISHPNGSQSLRSVPMEHRIEVAGTEGSPDQPNKCKSLAMDSVPQVSGGNHRASLITFLPMCLRYNDHAGGGVGTSRRVELRHLSDDNNDIPEQRLDWIITTSDADAGHHQKIQLQTTHNGQFLHVSPDGSSCRLLPLKNSLSNDEVTHSEGSREDDGTALSRSQFFLLRFSDFDSSQQTEEDPMEDDMCSFPSNSVENNSLWALQSVPYGTYLGLVGGKLVCLPQPMYWQVHRFEMSLCLASWDATPAWRQHYRIHDMTQTVDYVLAMHTQYNGNHHRCMSVYDALMKFAAQVPGYFLSSLDDRGARYPSLCTRCFRFAEFCRTRGHPDWVQLVALLYHLGGIGPVLFPPTSAQPQYDWWSPNCRSRIVGCPVPESAVHAEFRSLNPDTKNDKYSSTPFGLYETPHCGLSHLYLSWSGPEYMYQLLLRHSSVRLPPEGMAMLRYAPLVDWHTKNLYTHLANHIDNDLQGAVRDFDEMVQLEEQQERDRCALEGQRQTGSSRSLRSAESDVPVTLACRDPSRPALLEECDVSCLNSLWNTYYSSIATKYGLDGVLSW
jgi:inositol oxygenase